MKLAVGIALATKREMSSDEDEAPEETGGGLVPTPVSAAASEASTKAASVLTATARADTKVALTFFSLTPSALGNVY